MVGIGQAHTERTMTVRKLGFLAGVLVMSAALVAAVATGDNGTTNNKTFEYAIGLWGDLPYSDVQAQTGVPNLIADMNNSEIAFSVNDGDLKAGNGIPGSATPTTCSDALYAQGLGFLNSLRQPAMFTPGDNDWTDCDRTSNGGYNDVERLQHERQVFFSTDRSLGKQQMKLAVQSTPNCLGWDYSTSTTVAAPCVENRRWTYKRVTYATVNIQGTCNNRCSSGTGDPAGDEAEYQARNAADLQWLQDTFDEANTQGSAAVMIIGQADPGFDDSDATRAPTRNPRTLVEDDANAAHDGYVAFLTKLRDLTIAFKRPVVYVHGDSHYFRVDRPLLDSSGRRLENFTRVETFGDNQANGNNDVQWVKALVDPSSRDVFAFQAQIVPANRTAVPAP
jgi:hypothetical protein